MRRALSGRLPACAIPRAIPRPAGVDRAFLAEDELVHERLQGAAARGAEGRDAADLMARNRQRLVCVSDR